jgi:hypothetical protein
MIQKTVVLKDLQTDIGRQP